MVEKVDAALKHALAASPADRSIPVVFVLRTDPVSGLPHKKEMIDAAIGRLMVKAATSTQTPAPSPRIFYNLGAFALEAPRGFIEALLSEDAIESAVGEHTSKEVFVGPVQPESDKGR
jgi:hypothetical protein